MAKVTKNLPKTIVPVLVRREASLESLIGRIREHTPPEYYAGRGSPGVAVPMNVLMFHRLKRSDLLAGEPSSHHRFVLIVNEGGDGTVMLDDVLVPLSPGQAVLIFPYQLHHYADLRTNRLCWLFVTFELPRTETLEPLRYRPVPVGEAAREHVRRMCEYWIAQQAKRFSDDRLILEGAMLLQEMLRAAARGEPKSADRSVGGAGRALLQSIGEYLNNHLDQPVAVADLAEHVSLSESHLRARFRRHFGMSLGRYIRRTKITRAAQLLDVTEMTVGEVAHACGFDSIYAFSRVFRRNTNLSPRQYRRREKSREA